MRAVLAVLLLLAGPAQATQDAFPALYDVVGVASDDVLNIRSGPGAEFEVIGTLAPDAEGVEVIAPNDRFTWAQINSGEGTGWISMSFVVPQPGQWDGSMPEIRQCFGTEPFWSLTYAPPAITLSMPDEETREGLISSLYASNSHRGRFAYTGAFFPTETGVLDIHLSLRREACNDGMSDRAYGIGVDILLTPSVDLGNSAMHGLYSGCCSLTPPPAR